MGLRHFHPLLTPDLCLFNPGIDNETEIKSEDSEYQEWEDKLDSIDLNDPDELVLFIE